MPDPRVPTLVGDVGGTNTRLALARNGALIPTTLKRYCSGAFPGFFEVLGDFRATTATEGVLPDVPAVRVIAVAGMVDAGRSTLTN